MFHINDFIFWGKITFSRQWYNSNLLNLAVEKKQLELKTVMVSFLWTSQHNQLSHVTRTSFIRPLVLLDCLSRALQAPSRVHGESFQMFGFYDQKGNNTEQNYIKFFYFQYYRVSCTKAVLVGKNFTTGTGVNTGYISTSIYLFLAW